MNIWKKRDNDMSEVEDNERIARIIFIPYMMRDGALCDAAFPMDELLKYKKDGCSVDRCDLLKNHVMLLRDKASKYENPEKGRSSYGFATAKASEIRALQIDNAGVSAQALDISADPKNDGSPPDPWNHAHALLHKYDESYTRGQLRGMRDKLKALFSSDIVVF